MREHHFYMVLMLALAQALMLMLQAGAQTSSVFVIEENGPRGERVNFVFLSEGYTAAEMPAFAAHVDNTVNYIFSREPWKQYRSYCNVYRIQIASSESGTDNGAGGGQRNTYFNSGFNTPSVPQLLTIPGSGQSLAYVLLNQHVPEYDVPVIIVNDTKYGGSGGSISVASVHSSSALLVEHEIGHSFAGLADEYDYDYPPYTPVESYNATQEANLNLLRWNSWIETGTPVPTPEISLYNDTVGLFEGANYRTTGWYRPHNNSVMRSLGQPVGSLNREKFVLSYYDKISPVDEFSPAAMTLDITVFEAVTCSVTPKDPSEGPDLDIQWRVNGADQEGETGSAFMIEGSELGPGAHTITAIVSDPTTFVRDDPANNLLSESIAWTINVSDPLPATLAAWRAAFGADHVSLSGDGVSTIEKYALGLNPNVAISSTQRPFVSMTEVSPSERYLTMTVTRTARRTDIDYRIRSSGDLQLWNAGPGHTVVIEDSESMLKVRDAIPVNSAPRRYLLFDVREQ